MSKTVVTVYQCRLCGSIISSTNGVNEHVKSCSFQNHDIKRPNLHFEQMVTVNFPCPIVAVGRMRFTPEKISNNLKKRERKEVESDDFATHWPQKSSLRVRALEILRRVDSSEDIKADSEENESADNKIVNKKRKLFVQKSRVIKNASVKNVKEFSDWFAYRCSHCPARFNKEDVMKKHEDCVHGEGSKGKTIFTCPICQRMLPFRLIFQSHLKNHENAEALEAAFDLWRKWPPRSKVRKKPFHCSCKYCVMPLTSHRMFLYHMKTEHGEKTQNDTYSCTYCTTPEGKNVKSMKLLFRHIQTIHTMEYYGTAKKNPETKECPICKKPVNYYYFEDHMKKRHSNGEQVYQVRMAKVNKPDNPFSCPLKGCEAKLKSLAQLKSHFIIHLENNPYRCPYPDCNVRCDAECHLKRHMELHSGKGFQCQKCQLFFSRIDRLKNHKCDDKHPKTRRHKNHYDNNGILRSHYSTLRLKRMSVIGEQNADEILKTKERININKIIETDPVFIQACKDDPGFHDLIFPKDRKHQKPRGTGEFKCSKCDASFPSLRSLNNHKTQMHLLRPYKCGKCKRSFLKLHGLKRHVSESHQNQSMSDNDLYFWDSESGCSGKWKCKKCGFQTAFELSIRRHWSLKHNVTIPSRRAQLQLQLEPNIKEKSKAAASSTKEKVKMKRKSAKRKFTQITYSDSDSDDANWIQEDVEESVTVKVEEPVADFSIVKTEPATVIKHDPNNGILEEFNPIIVTDDLNQVKVDGKSLKLDGL